MSRRTFHSTEEWMQLVTTCRQSGLSDKDWCTANGINISTFYNAVARLRQKACQIPERETNTDTIHDLTVKALPDVVLVSIIPETKTGLPAAPALQDAAVHYDNSHMVQITTGLVVCRGSFRSTGKCSDLYNGRDGTGEWSEYLPIPNLSA